MIRPTSLRRTIPILLGIALLGVAAPAAAGIPGHSGDHGFHWPLSSDEYPGATCFYDADLHLDRITVRGPVIFGHDQTGGEDSQKVGWQIRVVPIDSTAGAAAVILTQRVTATASDRWPAHFTGRGVDKPWSFWNDHPAYGIEVKSTWFRPSDTVDGSATDMVPRIRWAMPGPDSVSNYCPAQAPEDPVRRSPAGISDTGDHGLHFLLDSREYPAITCVTDNEGYLAVVNIRRPILFADDRGPGVQSQKVSWRARVYPAPLSAGSPAGGAVYTSTWRTATASETSFADFLPIKVARPRSDWEVYSGYVVTYEFRWLYPGTTIDGTAIHGPALYWILPETNAYQCLYQPVRPATGAVLGRLGGALQPQALGLR